MPALAHFHAVGKLGKLKAKHMSAHFKLGLLPNLWHTFAASSPGDSTHFLHLDRHCLQLCNELTRAAWAATAHKRSSFGL